MTRFVGKKSQRKTKGKNLLTLPIRKNELSKIIITLEHIFNALKKIMSVFIINYSIESISEAWRFAFLRQPSNFRRRSKIIELITVIVLTLPY